MEMSSARTRRLERYHKLGKQPALNLISLMDIFTILVFFLLVTSSSSEQLPNSKNLRLPTSIAKKAPKITLVIMVTNESILVQGRQVARLNQIAQDKTPVISGLMEELIFQSKNKPKSNDPKIKKGLKATIMGDESISYELISRILATCRKANYTQIAFAANQKTKPQ